jgi:hypothetical protein
MTSERLGEGKVWRCEAGWAGRSEGARCGPSENRVGITDSDTSLCERSTGAGKALWPARGYVKLGATSSWKGYTLELYYQDRHACSSSQ